MKPRHNALLEKSLQAALSAIELYNKPNFSYREESFSILIINAWELLLKAKKLKDNQGRVTALYIKEYKKKKNGEKSKTPTYKKNRAGNYLTVGIIELLNGIPLDKNLKVQVETLIEVRDSSVHYMNSTKLFESEFLGIAAATLKSYEFLMQEWFDKSLADYNLLLIPLTFSLPETISVENIKCASEAHKNLLKYLGSQKGKQEDSSKHNISLLVSVKFERGQKGIGVKFQEDGTPIIIDTEDSFKCKYPLNFNELKKSLKSRYIDFKLDKKFWKTKAKLEEDEKLSSQRFLDYDKQSGSKKRYYSSNIITEFDKLYNKKNPRNLF